MTGQQKFTWGLILNISGSLSLVLGTIFSLSLIGACIGIPMIFMGLAFGVWGAVWIFQGRAEKQRESIASGIREGMMAAASMTWPQNQLKERSPEPFVPTVQETSIATLESEPRPNPDTEEA